MEYKTLNKKAIGCMRLNSIIWSIMLLITIIITVAILLSENIKIPSYVYIALGILAIICILYDIIAPVFRYKRYRYYIDSEMFVVVEGLWFIKKSIAPIERIHQIAVSRGPIDRIFGLSKVSITTAGGVIVIRFLDDEIAQEIADSLKVRINNIVKEQGVKDIG
ncbi:MAG: PH domain-containing protein [Oscillospiraceae bacterium]